MSVGVAHASHTKIGTCPHGMPPGACPICSGMAGGNSTTKRDIPRNVGEMTYNQCAAIGAMLRAQKVVKQRAQLAQQNHLQSLADFAKNLASIQAKITEFTAKISNTMPAIIAKPINFVLNKGFAGVISFVGNVISIITNISQKFVEISDKLSAIFGEAKSAIQKTVSDFWNKMKKKFKSIFFAFGTDENDNEEYKIDEAKKAFNLKTFIHKLAQKLKERKQNEY